jgi:rod shape-determining protein MreD
VLEWGTVAFGIVAITLANRLVLAIMLTPQAPLTLTLIQMVMTIMIYPVVVLVAQVLFGLTRPAPGQVDSLGHRL